MSQTWLRHVLGHGLDPPTHLVSVTGSLCAVYWGELGRALANLRSTSSCSCLRAAFLWEYSSSVSSRYSSPVKLVGQLQAMKGTELKELGQVKKEYLHQRSVCTLPRLPPTHSSSFSFPCGDRAETGTRLGNRNQGSTLMSMSVNTSTELWLKYYPQTRLT